MTTPHSRARTSGAAYVGAASSGLHTIPVPGRDDVWRVYRGRLSDPAAVCLGTLAQIGPASWVATPAAAERQPFGWSGDRDEAARQLAARPYGIRLHLDLPPGEATRP